MFSCEFCKFCKNTFFHRTPLVAVSTSLTLCVHLDRYSCESLRFFIPTPWACSFAEISSWGRQSVPLERSIRVAPTTPELSRQLGHLFLKFNNACWVLNVNHIKEEIYFRDMCLAVRKWVSLRPLIVKEVIWWTYNLLCFQEDRLFWKLVLRQPSSIQMDIFHLSLG